MICGADLIWRISKPSRLCEQSRVPRGRCPRWIPCHETAGFFGFFRLRRAVALLLNPPQKAKGMCHIASTFLFTFQKYDRTLVRFTATLLWPAWLPVSVLEFFVRLIESDQYSVCSQGRPQRSISCWETGIGDESSAMMRYNHICDKLKLISCPA